MSEENTGTNDGKEELLRELVVGLTPLVEDVEAMKGTLYMILAKYEVQEAVRALSLCNEDYNEQLIRKFIVAKTVKGCTKRTIEFYNKELHRHLQAINKNVSEITTDDLRGYLAIRKVRDGLGKTTVHNIYRVFSSFFGWLYQEEYINHNPIAKLDMKNPRVHKEAFTAMEVERIRAAAETNRDRAIIEMLLSTGCRVTELVNIKIAELNNDRVVVHGKGEKDRVVYLNAKAKVTIEAYLKERKDNNPYLFAGMISITETAHRGRRKNQCKYWYKDPRLVDPVEHLGYSSVEAVTRGIGRKVDISPCNPHRFRHTCATMALRRGMDLMTVSRMLGHENVGTTQIYIDVDQTQIAAQHSKYVM